MNANAIGYVGLAYVALKWDMFLTMTSTYATTLQTRWFVCSQDSSIT